jgi:hypothetical protein
MKNAGSLLLLIGVASIALNVFDRNYEFLMWIDGWGDTVGWVIRGAAVIVGGGLYFVGGKSEGGVGEEPVPVSNKPATDNATEAE